jgi:hypothetical protein
MPARQQTYVYRSEPTLDDWDVEESIGLAEVGTFVVSGIVSQRELLQKQIWYPFDCDCVRSPDSFRFEDHQLSAHPVWDDPNEDPFGTCDFSEARICRMAAEEVAHTLYPVQGFYSTCEPESRYVSFVRFTRVAPAVSLPARGWVADEGSGEGSGM